jgi:predicted CXXCH cytochrome family protein
MTALTRCRSVRSRLSLVLGLFGLAIFAATLGESAVVSAPEQDAQAPSATADRIHLPLAGKTCVECHKQAESPDVSCLISKEQMCVLCHQIPETGGVPHLPESFEAICFECHDEKGFKGSFVHGPVAVGACLTCHDPHGGSAPGMLRLTGTPMCLTCHRDMDARFTNAEFKHSVAVSGCTDCHSPHASEQHYQLREDVPGLCAACHEKVLRDQEAATEKHSPVTEEKACLNCHEPHAAAEDRLLITDEMGVCLSCHDDLIKADGRELTRIGQLLAANPRHHGPIQSKKCSGCHEPHNASYFPLLAYEYPKGFYAPFAESSYDLCFQCHDSTLVTAEHTTTQTEFRDGDRNLHFVHVDRTPRGRACRTCHAAHASSSPKYMRLSVPFGNWDLPIKFQKTNNGGSCEPGCHAKKTYERPVAQSSKQ